MGLCEPGRLAQAHVPIRWVSGALVVVWCFKVWTTSAFVWPRVLLDRFPGTPEAVAVLGGLPIVAIGGFNICLGSPIWEADKLVRNRAVVATVKFAEEGGVGLVIVGRVEQKTQVMLRTH